MSQNFSFIHTADVHLGKRFVSLGDKASGHRQELKTTFSKIIEKSLSDRISFLLIAGDLFDSNNVNPADFALVREKLKQLEQADIKVFLIGGTHDYLGQNSIYEKRNLGKEAPNLTLFTKDNYYQEIPDLDLTIYGISNYLNKSTKNPLEGFKLQTSTSHNIVMAHGSVMIPEKYSPDDFPIPLEKISKLPINYLALGHWHSFYKIDSNPKSFYCGAPEALDVSQIGSGYILKTTVTDSEYLTEKIKIGTHKFDKIKIDVLNIKSEQELKDKISQDSSAKLARTVVLEGPLSPSILLNPKKIEEELGSSFFKIKIIDKTSVAIDKINFNAYPKEQILGSYLRLLKEKREMASTSEQKIIDKAMQLGIKELNPDTNES